jgi:hypothetical protein
LTAAQTGDEALFTETEERDFSYRTTFRHNQHVSIQNNKVFILVINQLDAQNLFYNKFISCLYMFRTPCAHRQEIKIVFYSHWNPDAVKYNFDLLTMSAWCSKHVEA